MKSRNMWYTCLNAGESTGRDSPLEAVVPGGTYQRFVAHHLVEMLPVPTGTTEVPEAGQFATEVRSLLHVASGAHGVF